MTTSDVRRLAAAMLQLAVFDYLGGEVYPNLRNRFSKDKKFHMREAKAWVENNKNHSLFSFINVCEILELNPNWIRRKLESGGAKISRKSKIRR